MEALLFGSAIVSALHAIFPTHWLPMVLIAKAEKWPMTKTLKFSLLLAIAHIASSITLGLILMYLGKQLSENFELAEKYIPTVVLIVFGIIYFTAGMKQNNHKKITIKKTGKVLFISLLGMMLLSPCIEINAFFIAASPYNLKGFLLIALIFSVLTLAGILLMVIAGLKFIKSIESTWLNKYEKPILGALMLLLGLFNWFTTH